MFSFQKLLVHKDEFFDLLEASAAESKNSVAALRRFIETKDGGRTLDEFILARRKEKRVNDRISEALGTTMFTALPREDIEALAQALYRIPKTVEKIGERLSLRSDLLNPASVSRQLQMLEEAVERLCDLVHGLREGAEVAKAEARNAELQKIEGEADRMMLGALAELYSGEFEPLKVIFLKDIFELLERVFDQCRDAGKIITRVVLKNS